MEKTTFATTAAPTRFPLPKLPRWSHSVAPVSHLRPHAHMNLSAPIGCQLCDSRRRSCLVTSLPQLSQKYSSAKSGKTLAGSRFATPLKFKLTI